MKIFLCLQLQIYFSKFPQIIISAPSLLHLIALCELLSPAYFSTPRPNQKFPVSAWRSAGGVSADLGASAASFGGSLFTRTTSTSLQ